LVEKRQPGADGECKQCNLDFAEFPEKKTAEEERVLTREETERVSLQTPVTNSEKNLADRLRAREETVATFIASEPCRGYSTREILLKFVLPSVGGALFLLGGVALTFVLLNSKIKTTTAVLSAGDDDDESGSSEDEDEEKSDLLAARVVIV
jgi:hypothetical protein